MSGHAILSPSSSEAWLRAGCTGYPALNYGKSDMNEYAAEGTAAHSLLEWCLTTGKAAQEFPHLVIHVLDTGDAWYGDEPPRGIAYTFEADDEMREYVQTVVDDILRHAKGNEVLAEQRVSFAATLGIDEKTETGQDLASGTADARVMDFAEQWLQVHDLKYGRSPKGIVYAGTEDDPNPQLGLYGTGALEEAELLGDWLGVELHIHQPRLDHKDAVRVPIEKMRAFAQSARARAAEALEGFTIVDGKRVPRPVEELDELGMLKPSEKGCHYCAAADFCPAKRRLLKSNVLDHFEVLEEVTEPPATREQVEELFARKYPLPAELSMLETFIEAVRKRVSAEIKRGEQVAGWKIVKGKKGARAWVKEKLGEIEKLFKEKFRLPADQMYSKKLISPTQAEKVLAESPKRWAQVNVPDYITQSEGGETLVPADDKRPALQYSSVRDQFNDEEGSDLL